MSKLFLRCRRPWLLTKAKEENKDLKGWFVIPAWDAQAVADTFRMLGSTFRPFSSPSLHF